MIVKDILIRLFWIFFVKNSWVFSMVFVVFVVFDLVNVYIKKEYRIIIFLR